MAEIQKIETQDTYPLRHEVLRPHQTIEQCQYPGDFDPDTAHFGVFFEDEIVTILSIYKVQNPKLELPESWQLRAMATKESVRGQGYGRLILQQAEAYAMQHGAKCIWANARLNAVGFYQKASYNISGNRFEIPNIGPHFLMYKKCGAQSR